MSGVKVVTIDGPAGAGKSTVARMVAERLGWRFLDTGAMYRGVAWVAMQRGVAADDASGLAALVAALRIDFLPGGGITLDGVDATVAIRSAEVTAKVSAYAAVPVVRQAMAAAQRRIGEAGRLVCEGRDMGTVVFPDAAVKIYLDAGPEVRADRRHAELTAAGQKVDRARLIEEIRQRDKADSERAAAPLRRVADQHYVDSSDVSRDSVVEEILRVAEDRL